MNVMRDPWSVVGTVELRYALRRYGPLCIATFLVSVLVGAAAAYIPAKTYVTGATLTVAAAGPSGPDKTTPTTASIGVMGFALPALQARAGSQALQDEVAADVPAEFRYIPVRVSAVASTSLLTISGTSRSAAAASAYVNAMANALASNERPMAAFRLTLLDSAPVPRRPVSPRPKPILIAAIVFGLISALFVGLATRSICLTLDPKTLTVRRFGATALGEIPRNRSLSRGRSDLLSHLASDSPGDLALAFQKARTNLQLRLAQTDVSSVAVIATRGGLGCSTIAVGIAYSLGSVGGEVVLIEADLQTPSLAKLLGVSAGDGLGSMTESGHQPSVQTTKFRGIGLVNAAAEPGKGDVAISPMVHRALSELRHGPNLLVVDAPPLHEAPDAMLVAALVDAVVLVVGPKPKQQVEATAVIAGLEEIEATVLGVVVNGVSPRRFRRANRNHHSALAGTTIAPPVAEGMLVQ